MISDKDKLDQALRLVAGHLQRMGAAPITLVVCGGAALLARDLQVRITQDVDILALMDEGEELVVPDPLPASLIEAGQQVAKTLGLPEDWLNSAPSTGENGLFQRGLPEGMMRRMTYRDYGQALRVYFAGPLDLIHFKLLASANVGGRHLDDLIALRPTEEDLALAARWAMGRDPSDQFRSALTTLLGFLGYDDLAQRL